MVVLVFEEHFGAEVGGTATEGVELRKRDRHTEVGDFGDAEAEQDVLEWMRWRWRYARTLAKWRRCLVVAVSIENSFLHGRDRRRCRVRG